MDYDDRQMEFDFKGDPDPETMFPACHDCSLMYDFHLVELKNDESKASSCTYLQPHRSHSRFHTDPWLS